MSKSDSFLSPHYDVLVVGGGPAGIVAATQAARAGAKTLLVEKSGMLGGTTTLNGINFPGLFHAWGRQVIAGIGWELVTSAVREAGGTLPDFSAWKEQRHSRLQILVNGPLYAALADELVTAAGADLLFHTMPAKLEEGDDGWRVQLCLKQGLMELHAAVVVDCTGDANAVQLAGLPLSRNDQLQPGTLIMKVDGFDFDALDIPALEKAFLAAVERGEMQRSDFQSAATPVSSFVKARGRNTMHVPGVDGATSEGKTGAEIAARAALLRIVRFFRAHPGGENLYVDHVAAECGIRETRTIKGESCITCEDYTSGRIWPDAVCYSFYPIDVHNTSGGGGIDTRYLNEGIVPTIPLGALLPKNSQRLIVAGRSACGDQEANSAFRVQASAMAMGQAAGATAALAALSNRVLRQVPLDDIHQLLRRHQAIVPEVGDENFSEATT